MWNIHGTRYDLTKFLDKHPGGRSILESCRGDLDCTPTFESYHAMSDMNKIKSIMQKYEIKTQINTNISPMYSFDNNGFYRNVQTRVRSYFEKRQISHHSNWFWLFKTLLLILIYGIAAYYAFFSSAMFIFRLCCTVIASITIMRVGFVIMHDASHCALSNKPWINNILSRITNAIALWDHRMWMIHHVYRHHTFTGDQKLDPDTMHLRPFVKKHVNDKESKFVKLCRKYPRLSTIVSTFVFPGIYVGQVIAYHFVWLARKYLWGMCLPPDFKLSLSETVIKLCILLMFAYSKSFLIVTTYLIVFNIFYALSILPDHDMRSTIDNKVHNKNIDWGESQVRNSGNFATNNVWFTELYGGINYQIEHHLFPSICHVHYKDISRIQAVLNNFASI
jgi:linoleoyl-CoA desaturase